jgi:hypothetical protein
MSDVKTRTPTDTLMEALEAFGEDEPRDVIVLYTTQTGDLVWHSSTSITSIKVGMLETAKFWVLENARDKDKEDRGKE